MASDSTKSDLIISKATDAFLLGIPDTEQAILEAIIKKINQLNYKNGKIVPNDAENKKIAIQIEKTILDAVNKTGYNKDVLELLNNFDAVDENVFELQKQYTDINVDESKIKLPELKQWAVDNALYHLKEGGFKFNVIQPLKESLTRAVLLGGTITDLEEEIRGKAQNILKGYTGNTVRDVFSQYEGVVQKKIETVYDLNAILYIGGIKTTSRAQCKRWVRMKVILKKDLQEEIDWAFKNGTGMIENTTPDTFTIYRGGYGCQHKAIPTQR